MSGTDYVTDPLLTMAMRVSHLFAAYRHAVLVLDVNEVVAILEHGMTLRAENLQLKGTVGAYLAAERRLRAHEAVCQNSPCSECDALCDALLNAEGDLRVAAGLMEHNAPGAS